MLTAEQIRAADDSKIEKIAVPEWGGDVYIRAMRGSDRESFVTKYASQAKSPNFQHAHARLIVWAACDEHGKPIFTDADVTWLTEKSCAPLSRLVNAISKLNGLRQEDVSELVENFADRQGVVSPSA